MSQADITDFKYWLDMAIKGVIGLLIGLAGIEYRGVKNKIEDLELAKHEMRSDILVIRNDISTVKDQVGYIFQKELKRNP